MAFNRGSRSGGRSFERRSFNDRGRSSRGSAQMFQAVCGSCGNSCEVPFRPTNGRPVFCSNCFSAKAEPSSGWEKNRHSSYSQSPGRFEDRQMFDAVCSDCGNNCKVPFKPSNEKPIYCSSCFENKKDGGSGDRRQSQSRPQNSDQFDQLNNKLDKILTLLNSNFSIQTPVSESTEEIIKNQPEEEVVHTEETTKPTKRKSPKK